MVWGIDEEVWGLLKWCNLGRFIGGVSLMWFGVFLEWFGVICDKV